MAETKEARPTTGTLVREGDGFGAARFGISTFSGNIVGRRNDREARTTTSKTDEARPTTSASLEAREAA